MIKWENQFCNITEYISVSHSSDAIPCTIPHIHSYYEIYYNIFGAKGFMANGDFYECSERDLIVIPRLSAHKVVIKKDCKYERCLINIDEAILGVLEMASQMSSSLAWLTGDDATIPRRVNLSFAQHEEFMQLIDTYRAQNTQESALGAFTKILAFLRLCFQNPCTPPFMDEESISHTDRIIRIIEKDFRTLTVTEIASLAHCSRDYVSRVFKADTGTPISTYLILRKLAEAQKHLYLGKSVKETCYLSGFNDYANFFRTFKKYMGYTPGGFDDLNIM